ncbi:MAG: NAD(P)/FAD-dependent oxidoreductase [Flavobacteriaceae bacterium]
MKIYDVIIIGGGLAGLTAALHLSESQLSILLIEKHQYPHHKVCGEYLSNEVAPYLKKLGVLLPNPVSIKTLQLSTVKGTTLTTPLPLGGMGISRYTLDYALYNKVLEKGVEVKFGSVKAVDFEKNTFILGTVDGHSYLAEIVIGAYGKRSGIDKHLQRSFIKSKSPWLAVKSHYHAKGFPDELVALHNFRGGYGGLSKTEKGEINFCYLANYKIFTKYKDIEHFNSQVVTQNPFLAEFLSSASPVFDKPITIAQISFERKQAVERHMLMCGDAAGLIHPLCGNGMAMAIHSAKMAAELVLEYFGSISPDRRVLENQYAHEWETTFKRRLIAGRRLQSMLLHPVWADKLMQLAVKSPLVLRRIIKSTHGQPLIN